MRRYLSLFLCLVTLAIAGCATSQPKMTTPSGTVIGDRVPNFNPVTGNAAGGAPLATAQNGVNNSTPYYNAPAAPGTVPTELQTVKIGVLVPLSGPQADLGQAMLNAAQLALFDVNAKNITIVPRDTTLGAAKAANEVLAEGAQIILGPLFAQDVKTVTPIAKIHNVPVLAFSTDWTAATDNTYIMGFLPFGQVSRVVDYAIQQGAHNFGALIPQTPYGIAVNSSLKNELQRQRLSAPYSLIFNPTSLTGATNQIAQNKFDALLLPIGGAQLSQSVTLLRQNDAHLGDTKLIGTGLWDDSPQAVSQLRGGWFAAPDPKLRASFTSNYQQTYGTTPPRLSTLAYDATALSAALAAKGQRNGGPPAFTRADLTDPNGFAGIDGVFRFRSDSLAERGLAVLELRSNGPVVIDPAPTHF
jgi:branched-chain amino acid transport system substrate-binding protein